MLYDYEKRDFKIVKTEAVKVSKDVLRTKIEYESFIQTPYPKANKVIGYLFEPEQPKTNIPLIFLHGMGDKNLVSLSWFPHQFAKNGIPSFLMIVPYHFERTPKGMKSGKKFLLDDLENVQPTKKCFLFDPLTFGHYLKEKQVIMYNALLDEVIPRQAAQELWQEMGKPERHWLFSGHGTSIFYRKRILNRSLELFLS